MEFDSQQQDLLMRITSPLYLNRNKSDKFLIDDRKCLVFFPVLKGVRYCQNLGISKKLAKSLSWIFGENADQLLKDDFSEYVFIEHSLFLLKEHFKMVLNYSHDIETKKKALKMLNKLNKAKTEISFNLERFLKAQEIILINGNNIYEQSLKEITDGYLETHCWIRYLFPQMRGLGKSDVTNYYGIKNREEAKAYISHPILKERLIEICKAVLNNKVSVYDIFGEDTMRIRACVLLFASVSDEPVFKQLIQKYCW